ncbi:ABC transporter ATP-binding protein [Shouchella clausii]|uniref:ABC transporter ATP-binding protein n=1 Tax=Shouchella clausii TaxID=79880 RepID=UPI000B96A0EB|nr:ABC transporter ATP-binding protein [Shouchella clausii]AST94900.1 peptide ABC transporter ATP-binding protein [Shouchella clausii]MCM3550827.1 ABC transporter ATP-binding protein [Shouchella clausii]MCR1288827.1 ABC transporter ATP-binding protein [Shouchella clausii]MEB5473328.1 ABC transporter ATP-binding protein [Shouchella clausii]MED4159981.1 ABC transporter ATP-binding protein [Shouchella clausii]
MALLQLKQLHIAFKTYGGEVQAVRGVNLSLEKGETLAVVGESGCGKSVTAQSIMGLLPKGSAAIKQGEILFKEQDLTKLPAKKMRRIQGNEISMIFQDPMTSLNPSLTVGTQLTEGIRKHTSISASEANHKALEMLEVVGIANGKERLKQYPHEFSGGMRQRLMIAMALICKPDILIADEPTTALDVTIQAQILKLFKDIQRQTGVAIMLITHDLGVVAQLADRVHVMYAGKIVETSNRRELFYNPQHPYTKGLLHSVPRLDGSEAELEPIGGTPPDLFAPPAGCPFAPRCAYAMDVCRSHMPAETKITGTHAVSCWLEDLRAKQVFKELA